MEDKLLAPLLRSAFRLARKSSLTVPTRCFGLLLALAALLLLQSRSTANPLDAGLQEPQVGDHALNILSPNLLELFLVNTKQPDPARVTSWDWVNDQLIFVPPNISSVRVVINGQTNLVAGIGFKRRALYAPLLFWDLKIGNQLYLQLSNAIPDRATVQVINDGTLWPADMAFASTADPLRLNAAIHVNQEGYLPAYPKKATVGYFLGNLGEMPIPANTFFVVSAQNGTVLFQGNLTLRPDVGYTYTPTPYQNVYEADFSAWTAPGQYRLLVPGMGTSLPFRIDEGIAMDFTRTYALEMFHQRSGVAVALPFTRFTHAADHTAPASVPTNDSAPFAFTWQTVSNYSTQINSDNPPQIAPILTNYSAQLYPFLNQGAVSVSGGHFEAGDYNRVTYNGANLIHVLVFAADSLPGVGALDNLGIPESGDGISDVLQEAKFEADFLAKMQDADGGFYYSVYPQFREYEMDVLPENGDPQVIWPKNTATTAAAVAALAQCSSSPRFKQAYPQTAANYWASALRGWQFLTNAIARFGLDGAYQHIQHFDDDFTHHDELAWAACEMYLASADPQYQAQLFQWFPDPTDLTTFHWGWQRMYACYGNAVRDYAFAIASGRLTASQIQPDYLAKCVNVITNRANDILGWSQDSAYGTSFPDLTKAYRGGGWYFSTEQAFDLAVGYQFSPNPQYLDALLRNLNYEGGCNPVNVCYLTGLGWKRQQNVVDQYSLNDRRVLPKTGVSVSNIQAGFLPTWVYGYELLALSYPPDSAETAPYPYYDRWCDDWNVSTECSTTDTARSFATAAWLAARTSLAGQSWSFTNATIIPPLGGSTLPGLPVTLLLNVADPNLNAARIVWEASGQQPSFGTQSYTFTAGTQTGAYWVEAEVQWPDGRRAFATNVVMVSSSAPPLLMNPQSFSGAGFSFTLAGIPQATYAIQVSTDMAAWNPILTNTLPANGMLTISDSQAGSFSRRYYRAVRLP